MKTICAGFSILTALLLIQGCASVAQAADTGVSGTVSVAPGCPGPQRKDHACEMALADREIQLLDHEGKLVAHAMTDANGQFQFQIPAGKYSTHVVIDALYPKCNNTDVVVETGGVTKLVLMCDSGMRGRR